MELGLRGQLVVITGSTLGIGYGIAVAFAEQGARVVLNGRTQSTTDAARLRLIAETGANPTDVFAVAADLSKKDQFSRFVAEVDAIGVPVEVLINNHGVFEFCDFFTESDEKWEEYFQVNVLSQVRLSRHYLKGMLERKHGRVLFSSSAAGAAPVPGGVAYSVSKTSQIALARGLSELTKNTAVTVNSVLIGPTLSDGASNLFGKLAQSANVTQDQLVSGFLASEVPSYKLDRLENPKEIANVFLFLASKHGIVVNGAAQRAEAGALRYI